MTAPEIRYCLLADGGSDRALRHPIRWLLESLGAIEAGSQWADLRFLPAPARDLAARIVATTTHYEFDILFVHRDAEREPYSTRLAEVEAAAHDLPNLRFVPVVPVRAMEAWLLHDEQAIRRAAGNPNGTLPLDLPRISDLERVLDPKARLEQALKNALPHRPRERARVRTNFGVMRNRVAELADYAALALLPAFAALRERLSLALATVGVAQSPPTA